ncbi:MAG: universal stress protein [Acidobacteria bacterium]|jgi:hypothetical protein|nr:universal stress protein [Acidobacteriota bacterium]
MTRQSIRGIGYCARMTPAGDWAFDFALDLALLHDVRLNIFFFPSPPCQPHLSRGRRGERAELSSEKMVALERETRLYYDQLLGDYVNVGFRLCEGDEEPELRRCLIVKRDYDVLVLAYEGYRCQFGSKTIEELAEGMPCPTILVGPERPDQLFLNSAAELWVEELALDQRPWRPVNGTVVIADQDVPTTAN